jgi:putative Mn2+ efflux pump MntP
MNVIDVILIGVALSMDACAITIANCSSYKNLFKQKKAWSMPFFFALFQGIMPLIGFFVGSLFAKHLESFAGYIVSAVFFALAIKIIVDIKKSKCDDKNDKVCERKSLSYPMVIIQALATSIDALLVGVTLSIGLTFAIWWAVLLIAVVTAILVLIALILGKLLGDAFGKYAEWVGAIILFGLAIKELIMAIV